MAITSSDIDNQSFSVERKGYSIEEVDIFLEKVSNEVGDLNDQIEELSKKQNVETTQVVSSGVSDEKVKELNDTIAAQAAKIEKLTNEVNEKADDGRAISEALIVAQREADKIISRANDKASKIIKDANDKADYIEKETDNEKKRVQAEIDKLEKDCNITYKKYQNMLRDIVKEMEKHIDNNGSANSNIHPAAPIAPAKTNTVKPVKNHESKAPTVKPEPSKDFSGFGDADFGSDKID